MGPILAGPYPLRLPKTSRTADHSLVQSQSLLHKNTLSAILVFLLSLSLLLSILFLPAGPPLWPLLLLTLHQDFLNPIQPSSYSPAQTPLPWGSLPSLNPAQPLPNSGLVLSHLALFIQDRAHSGWYGCRLALFRSLHMSGLKATNMLLSALPPRSTLHPAPAVAPQGLCSRASVYRADIQDPPAQHPCL